MPYFTTISVIGTVIRVNSVKVYVEVEEHLH